MNGPISLADLFGSRSDSESDRDSGNEDDGSNSARNINDASTNTSQPSTYSNSSSTAHHNNSSQQFKQNYENVNVKIVDTNLKIRQFSWHPTNANQVWPGTYRLAEYIINHSSRYNPTIDAKSPTPIPIPVLLDTSLASLSLLDQTSTFLQPMSSITPITTSSSSSSTSFRVLELGAATGALAIFLKSAPYGFDMMTSDIDDGGEVENNLIFNFNINGLNGDSDVCHIPYSWGTNWKNTLQSLALIKHPHMSATEVTEFYKFKYIIASDILLYVSVYPALVASLLEMFEDAYVEEFLMSWNRRIAESKIFFELMTSAGFDCVHQGHCIYSFTRSKNGINSGSHTLNNESVGSSNMPVLV